MHLSKQYIQVAFKPVLALMAMLVIVACASGPSYDPGAIKPVYEIRNAPIPVPNVHWNPRRSQTAYAAQKHTKRPIFKPVAKAIVKPAPTATASVARAKVTVRKGDTLYALSRRHKVPVRSLISANRLRAPYSLAVGQKLTIPTSQYHTVKKGDTGYSISRQYGVTVSSLMRVNGIRKPFRLSVGQRLNLPGGAKAGTATYASNTTTSRSKNSPVSRKPSVGRTVAIPSPPPRSKSGFIWPVKGKLASRFGPREGGLHNDGINILAKPGSPVKAADAGVVVYASNALEGYGNLLLLKHSGGWVTAYAHNERLLVRPGQKIQRGQVVARVGSTGGVKVSQLHFEIRKGRKALDPLRHLTGRTASGG